MLLYTVHQNVHCTASESQAAACFCLMTNLGFFLHSKQNIIVNFRDLTAPPPSNSSCILWNICGMIVLCVFKATLAPTAHKVTVSMHTNINKSLLSSNQVSQVREDRSVVLFGSHRDRRIYSFLQPQKTKQNKQTHVGLHFNIPARLIHINRSPAAF